MAAVRYVDVHDATQMQNQISSLIMAGFTIANQTPTSTTLIKRKQFSILWLVIGLLLCVIPLLIYLIVYAAESDQIVEIRLVGATAGAQPGQLTAGPAGAGQNPPPGYGPQLQLSPDRQHWWDGTAWQPTATTFPPNAVRNADGRQWWDGTAWREIPTPPA